MKTEAAKQVIQDNILGSHDVQEILLVNRQRLRALVEAGKLTPVKELKRESLFWLPEVNQLKQEIELDSRTNLFKKRGVVNK